LAFVPAGRIGGGRSDSLRFRLCLRLPDGLRRSARVWRGGDRGARDPRDSAPVLERRALSAAPDSPASGQAPAVSVLRLSGRGERALRRLRARSRRPVHELRIAAARRHGALRRVWNYCLSSAVRQGIVEVEGAQLAYRIEGHGQPCLVVGSSIYYPRVFSQDLRSHLQLVFVDLRHFAASDPSFSPDRISIETYPDDIEHVSQTLELGDVVVMGHSIHGTIALEYARRYPER